MRTIERHSIDRFDLSRSFLFYAAGTGSLLVIDLVIGQYLAGDELAAWAFARSAIFLGASFVLLGLDQALLRIRVEPPIAFAKTLLARAALAGVIVLALSLLATSALGSVSIYMGAISLALLYALGGLLPVAVRHDPVAGGAAGLEGAGGSLCCCWWRSCWAR